MDTFRKWLNKPKTDDKSLLARFYHADRSLTAVASELDSFDGRAEPDRCSRLVGRLRQGQDKVLAITNLIMEELLGEDRDQRAFRAKFPDEVLQENLAGQLWFGAECLAAGSSIMNREAESREMRPLAQAVTKSLGNVRNLLRDQCLRNNVPNSKTLHLDYNDTTTEQLYESLKIFDRLFAEFELRYVSAMVQVKTKQEYEMQELICVLFSETLQRALSIGLLEQEKVDAFDPALMFSIPRLAIIAGLVIYPKGPLNMDMSAEQLSEMFRPFRTILIKIRDLLRKLSKQDLLQLERLLCTNEEIQITVPVGTSSIEAPSPDQQNNNSNNNGKSVSDDGSTHATSTDNQSHSTSEQRNINNNNINNNNINNNSISSHSSTVVDTQATSTSPKKVLKNGRGSNSDSYASRYAARSPSMSSVSADSSAASTPTASPMASPTPSHSIASTSSVASTSTTSPQWSDDEDNDNAHDDLVHEAGEVNVDDDNNDDNENLAAELYTVFDIVDLASGYLIPNTNLGNLLQPQEVPLTDNFVASEDEFGNHQNADDADLPTTSASVSLRRLQQNDYEQQHEQEQARKLQARRQREATCRLSGSSAAVNYQSASSPSCSSSSLRRHSHHEHTSNAGDSGHAQHRHHHHHHSHGHGHHHHNHQHRHHHHRHRHHSKGKRCSLDGCPQAEDAANCVEGADVTTTVIAASSNAAVVHLDTSSVDSSTTSSLSEGGPHDVALAVRTAGRKLKTVDNLLHRLFVCIAGVADQLQTNFASDLRQILRSVFLMNMLPAQEEIDIPEKTKESELFEFRASENDVIHQSGGSNQSIYSAEEVNPELDSVFNNNNNNNNNNNSGVSSARHSSGGAIQRGNTIDLGASGESSSPDAATAARRNQIGRSRSLGDHEHNNTPVVVAGGCSGSSRRAPSYANSRQNNAVLTLHNHNHQRNRNNSVGSNSPSSSSSSSESNSPVSGRTSSGFQHATRQPLSCSSTGNNNHNNNNDMCYDNASSAGEHSTATITATDTTTGSPQSLSNGVVSTAAAVHNARQAPPAWVPDDKAPRCMSCHTPFTAFRRRHHCRNCGGVFCGVCSNASAPLPKYGLTKAVRVCRECYVREVRANTANSRRSATTHARAATTTAGGS